MPQAPLYFRQVVAHPVTRRNFYLYPRRTTAVPMGLFRLCNLNQQHKSKQARTIPVYLGMGLGPWPYFPFPTYSPTVPTTTCPPPLPVPPASSPPSLCHHDLLLWLSSADTDFLCWAWIWSINSLHKPPLLSWLCKHVFFSSSSLSQQLSRIRAGST